MFSTFQSLSHNYKGHRLQSMTKQFTFYSERETCRWCIIDIKSTQRPNINSLPPKKRYIYIYIYTYSINEQVSAKSMFFFYLLANLKINPKFQITRNASKTFLSLGSCIIDLLIGLLIDFNVMITRLVLFYVLQRNPFIGLGDTTKAG